MAKWLPIEDAPMNTTVRVRAGGKTFLARLVPNASVTEDGEDCDQWQAEVEGKHPRCWSDGACWASNADQVESAQPTHWQPADALISALETKP